MCVIVHKSMNHSLPNMEILCQCWDANPDGAGVSYYDPKRNGVAIAKGFMSFDKFADAAKQMKAGYDVVYHFRIATSGGTTPEMTHPFPVSQHRNMLRATKSAGRYAIAHNGVLGRGSKDMSDTALFIQNELAPVLRKVQSIDSYAVRDLLAPYSVYNRFVLQDGDNHMTVRVGEWHNYDGCWFSNMHWKEPIPPVHSKLLMDIDDDAAPYSQCPFCAGDVNCISIINGLYECQMCGQLFDECGNPAFLTVDDGGYDGLN